MELRQTTVTPQQIFRSLQDLQDLPKPHKFNTFVLNLLEIIISPLPLLSIRNGAKAPF
jgi:hypothetical protein